MNPQTLTLYGCLICPYVQRSRAALVELGIPYNYEEVDLLRNQQFSDWYKGINPISKVPALILPDKRIVCESLVIVEYLNDVYGKSSGKSIFPDDLVEKSRIKQWVSYLDSSIIGKMFPMYAAIKEDNKEKVLAGLKEVQEGLKFLVKNSGYLLRKQEAEKSSGNKDIYFWGAQFTFFDLAVLPFIQNFEILIRDYYPDVDIFKAISEEDASALQAFEKYYRFAYQRPSFQESNNQVTTLPETKRSTSLEALQVDNLGKWSYAQYHQHFMAARLRPVPEAK